MCIPILSVLFLFILDYPLSILIVYYSLFVINIITQIITQIILTLDYTTLSYLLLL
jgi:hypothetical protein